jgi:hypothetical protein
VLCCVVLCCVVLCCVVLCCVVLRCVVLRCVVLCCVAALCYWHGALKNETFLKYLYAIGRHTTIKGCTNTLSGKYWKYSLTGEVVKQSDGCLRASSKNSVPVNAWWLTAAAKQNAMLFMSTATPWLTEVWGTFHKDLQCFQTCIFCVLTNVLFFVRVATWNRWRTSQSRAVQRISESGKAKIIENDSAEENPTAHV